MERDQGEERKLTTPSQPLPALGCEEAIIRCREHRCFLFVLALSTQRGRQSHDAQSEYILKTQAKRLSDTPAFARVCLSLWGTSS